MRQRIQHLFVNFHLLLLLLFYSRATPCLSKAGDRPWQEIYMLPIILKQGNIAEYMILRNIPIR